MTDAPHLRVSDQERDEAATAIREHYAAGRLDSAEFEERVHAAYNARTRSELDALSADLPALPPKPPTTIELARRKFDSNELARNVAAGGGAFVVAVAVWAVTGANNSFWPKWVLVVTLITIVRGIRRGAGRVGGGHEGTHRQGGHADRYESPGQPYGDDR